MATAKKPVVTTTTLQQLPNILSVLPSYTYGISLHLIKPTDYNTMMGDPNRPYTPRNVLIASAGRHGTDFERNRRFQEDFYIEDFTMDGVVGVTKGSAQNTTFEFKIIEPYGVTFFDRILAIMDDDASLRGQAWFAMPFMLQIDFFGYDDEGNQSDLRDLTKYIPIKFSKFNLRITGQGAEYQTAAYAYSHEAFNQSSGSTPTNIELKASTVGEYFIDYAKRLNAWQKTLQSKNKIEVPTIYTFDVVDESLRNSKIANPDPKYAPMGDVRQNNVSAEGNRAENASAVDKKNSVFSLNAGTSISTAIENAVKVSGWFTEQLGKTGSTAPIQWIKIFPEITLTTFDKKLNAYGKNITYRIMVYNIYDNKYGIGPTPRVPNSKGMKSYEYIYSGKNTELLEWNLEFNTLWVALESVQAKAFKDITGEWPGKNPSGDSTTNNIADTTIEAQSPKTPFQPQMSIPVGQQPSETATGGVKKDTTTIASADMLKTILRTGKDMVTLNIRILGDPDFIKQDGIFYPGGSNITPGKGLQMDGDALYVKLSFKTYVDIDESTGLYTHNTPSFTDMSSRNIAVDSSFSGYYTVNTIKSHFRSGKFEQELVLSRAFMQELDNNTLIIKEI